MLNQTARVSLFSGNAACCLLGCLIVLHTHTQATYGADRDVRVAIDPAKAGPDFAVQGEYLGELDGSGTVGVQVYAQGDGTFRATAYYGGLPGAGAENVSVVHAEGETIEGVTTLRHEHGSAIITNGQMRVLDVDGQEIGQLKRVERESPTLGLAAPEDALVLFDGSSKEEFKRATLRDHLLMAGTVSNRSFGDCTLHLEFRTPFMPFARGQDRGNSGVYIQNRYEVQVLDSFGLEGKDNECGGLYSFRKPDVNMCFPPLAWQTYDIEFLAARPDANARITVKHNGVTIHDDVELPDASPGAANESQQVGPLQLQFHLCPVQFRNIWIIEESPGQEQ